MHESLRVTVLQGRELSSQDLQCINQARKNEFSSQSLIDPKPTNDDWTKSYFLARDGEEIAAFGRLHDVDITFEGKIYKVLGIATIVAILKGQGYGKAITLGMKDYIEESGKTGLGFCDKKLSPFYKNCGYGIMTDGKKRFYHPEPLRFPEGDVIYISGRDGLIETMIRHPDQIATLSRPHW